MAPVQRCADRPLAAGQVTTGGRQVQGRAEAIEHGLRRQEAQSRGDQLDRQWEAPHPTAQLGDHLGVVRAEREGAAQGARPVDEQPYRRRSADRVDGVPGVGHVERRDRDLPLAPDP